MKNALRFWLTPILLLLFAYEGYAQQSICVGATKTYTVNGPGTGPVGSTYAWSLTGASAADYAGSTNLASVTANAITINWATTPAGTYTLQVIETNNSCPGAPVTLTITITDPPVAGTLAGTQEVCQGNTTQFSVTGNSAAGTWTTSDAAIATVSGIGLVTAVGVGTATITFTVAGSGGCADATVTRTVTVTAPPVAGTLAGTQAVCNGNTTQFSVTGNSAAGTWTTSDAAIATVDANGLVTAEGVGTATITFTVPGSGGCADAIVTRTVTVTAPPVAGTLAGTQAVCDGNTTQFSVTGNSAAGTWTTSDAAIATVDANGLVTAEGVGTATITFTVPGSGGCADATVTRTVTVTAPPVAGTLAGTQTVCNEDTTQFSVSGNSAAGTWTTSDAAVATVNSTGLVTAVGVGTATITFTVPGSGGCADATVTRTVTVNAIPSTSPITFD